MSLNDATKKMRAMKVYKDLLSFLDQKGWKYNANEEAMIVHLGLVGEDIPMPIVFEVDETMQLLRVMSALPFSISQDKYIDLCSAITYTNNHLPFGTFLLDMQHGLLSYRNTTFFVDNDIGAETFDLLIDIVCHQVDRYNDRFYAMEKGLLSLEGFITID